MKLTVHVTLSGDDDDTETVVREVFALKREALTPDTLGLGLAEAKDLLAAVQDTLVTAQVSAAVATQDTCPDCATPYRHKDKHTIVVRSLFGTLRLDSPRWWHCGCQPQTNRTFSPLTWILPERTTPELSYLQARFAGLVSYGASASLLSELLPLGRPLHATALRLHVHVTAQRLEDELGDERSSFIDTCQRDREELPRPQLPLVVGLDGGYVHSSQNAHAATAGSRSSPARRSPPTGGRPVSGTCRPTTPSPNAGCSRCSKPRA